MSSPSPQLDRKPVKDDAARLAARKAAWAALWKLLLGPTPEVAATNPEALASADIVEQSDVREPRACHVRTVEVA
jgi:hypothetical protein